MTFVTPDFGQTRPDIAPSKKEMLSVRKEGDKYFVRINSSSLSIMQSCARKSWYSLHRELKSRSESPALTFGKAIHKAMEVFYSQPRGERTIPKNFEEYAKTMAFGHEPPEKHFLYDAIKAFMTEAEPLANLPDTDKRSLVCGAWILSHYFKTYIDDIYEIYCDEQGPFVERLFSCDLYEDDQVKIELFGQIDFVLQHSANKTIIPGDHKTVSYLGADFYNRVKPNHQYTGYVIGAQRVFGISSSSFLVNGIQVKSIPKTKQGTNPNFVRQITDRSELDIAEFTDSVVAATKNYINWLETDIWPLGHVDICAQWGGCQYQEICSAPANLRENILDSKFISLKEE